MLGFLEHRVDFPTAPIRIVRPYFSLVGVTTCLFAFDRRDKARAFQSRDGTFHVGDALNTDAKVDVLRWKNGIPSVESKLETHFDVTD